MLHVHALHADPSKDASLLVTAHTGPFRIDGQGTGRISAAWHAGMAFAVAQDGSLLLAAIQPSTPTTCDYPEPPSHRGLERSSDGGRTWQSISLRGEADLHALVVTGDELLGAEATTGRLLASIDGGDRWQQRSQLDLLALAAHPEDTDLLVGATGDALVRGEDAGRTWTSTASFSRPVSANTAGFVAATTDGQVTTSIDRNNWEHAGQLPSTPGTSARRRRTPLRLDHRRRTAALLRRQRDLADPNAR